VVKIKLSNRSLTDESRIWGDKGTHKFGGGGYRDIDFWGAFRRTRRNF
jgi:hypothetical protein